MKYNVESFCGSVIEQGFTRLKVENDYIGDVDVILADLQHKWLFGDCKNFYEVIEWIADIYVETSLDMLCVELKYFPDVFEQIVAECGGLVSDSLYMTLTYAERRVYTDVFVDNLDVLIANYIVNNCLNKYDFDISDDVVNRFITFDMCGEIEENIKKESDDNVDDLYEMIDNLGCEVKDITLYDIQGVADKFINKIGEKLGVKVVEHECHGEKGIER